MPANCRRDLIRRLKVKVSRFSLFVETLPTVCPNCKAALYSPQRHALHTTVQQLTSSTVRHNKDLITFAPVM